MFRFKIAFLTLAVTFGHWTMFAESADAGLLRDWLDRRRARRCQRLCKSPCQTPIAAPVVTSGYAGLQPGQCATTCQQTCSRVVVNYVPCTSYRTTYERVPVTQYRPQTTSDPCTGCSVTCMRPCTTYTYRMRRVPYTTYRPVYRTETYRVPVTTITNDCNPCGNACNVAPTCNTCTTGAPVATQSVPNGTITTGGNYSLQNGTTLPPGSTITELPADSTPSLNPQNSNRSVIESLQDGSSTRAPIPQENRKGWELTSTSQSNRDWNSVPVLAVAKSPVTKRFAYTAIKQVSYVTTIDESEVETVRGTFAPANQIPAKQTGQNVNSGWETVEW